MVFHFWRCQVGQSLVITLEHRDDYCHDWLKVHKIKDHGVKLTAVHVYVCMYTDGGNGGNNLSKFELVKDCCFASSIKTHH